MSRIFYDTIAVEREGNTLTVSIPEKKSHRWFTCDLKQGAELMRAFEKALGEDVNISDKVGNKITSIRYELGVNQKEFARLTDSTVSAVSNWENNRNKPNNERLRMIADLGGISVEELLKG